MTHALQIAGEQLVLHADRAIHWPRAATLIVADVHLGKAAAFRRAGVAVPSGGTQDDLSRLDRLIGITRPQRLLVLGDLLHTRMAVDEPAIAAISAFRARHATLMIEVLRGNHDRATARLPAQWRIDWIDGARNEPPFVFAHQPNADPRGYVLAGHIHPVVRLRSRADSARLPVFWFGHADRVGVLPSFGAFTGGYAVRPAAADTVFGVTPDGLVALQMNSIPEAASCIS